MGIECIDFHLAVLLRRVLERILDAVNLIAEPIELRSQLFRLGPYRREMALI
jgi:hypothetical protein